LKKQTNHFHLNTHYTYFAILLGSIVGPLALSFDKKVAFFKTWKQVFGAMLVPAFFYVVWDIIFTQRGVWSFNKDYITGVHFFNLPVEEVLFFFVVPYFCTFIYACVKSYFPKLQSNKTTAIILKTLALIFFVVACFNFNRDYTFYTFLFCSFFILFLLFQRFNQAAFLVSYLIILIPFLIVNGFLTAIPVVIYNDAENLGIRIFTIPFEDVFYGLLLVMMNILGYEHLLRNSKNKNFK
jgi:lycopene cyclase domain-containing protein